MSYRNSVDPSLIDSFVDASNDQMGNPFYLDQKGSKYRYTTEKDLYHQYKRLFIVCLADDVELTPENKKLLDLLIQIDTQASDLMKIAKLLSIVEAPLYTLKNDYIRQSLVEVPFEYLKHYNSSFYALSKTELVVLMIGVKESLIKNWIKIYDKNICDYDQFISLKIFSSYYGIGDYKLQKYLISLINKIVVDVKYILF